MTELDQFIIHALRQDRKSDAMFSIEAQQWLELISTSVDSNQSLEHYYDNLYQLALNKVTRNIKITKEDTLQPNLD